MKNLMLKNLIVLSVIGVIGFGVTTPAFAATTSVYYDQFGMPHAYVTADPVYTANAYNSYGYSTTGYRSYSYQPNRPPIIWSTPVTTATAGSEYVAGINASDPDNDHVAFQLVRGPIGMYLNPTTGQLRWSVPASASGSYAVTVSASDGYNMPATQSFQLTIRSSSAVASTNGSSYTSSSKKTTTLTISDIQVISGPTNVYEDKTDVNCEVRVTWKTSVPATGQVVYGTVSQPKTETFKYPEAVAESTSLATTHEVKLGCLKNVTYYLRVIAVSGDATAQRTVSNEQIIFPIKIRTDIPAVGGTIMNIDSGASALSTIGAILLSPFVLIVLLGIAAFLLIRRFLRQRPAEAGHAVGLEPNLAIPHETH